MKTQPVKPTASAPLNVLLVGNNPIEMGLVLIKLQEVRSRRIITEIAFDTKSLAERLLVFKPAYILVDDNLGREEMQSIVNRLSEHPRTKDVPITILKNSNYRESLSGHSILDYLLKQNISGESLYNTIKNALRFRRTQSLLFNAYKQNRGILKKLSDKVSVAVTPRHAPVSGAGS